MDGGSLVFLCLASAWLLWSTPLTLYPLWKLAHRKGLRLRCRICGEQKVVLTECYFWMKSKDDRFVPHGYRCEHCGAVHFGTFCFITDEATAIKRRLTEDRMDAGERWFWETSLQKVEALDAQRRQ
jgi:hypothetical protein